MSHGGMSVPAGTYLDSLKNDGLCDHTPLWCDDLELQFFATSPGGNYTADLMTGISQWETWTGLWTIHTLRATAGNPIEVSVTESDNTSGDDHYLCSYDNPRCSAADNPLLDGSYWGPFL